MSKSLYPREFVTRQFNNFYQAKWIAEGKTAIDFAEAIKQVMPEANCDQRYVSKWKTGKMSPVKYLPAICRVLGVDLSEFTPSGHDERYQYAPDYADEIETFLENIAENNFKIDLTFFQGLRNITPGFDDLFPQFSPLCCFGLFDRTHKAIERIPEAIASETSNGKGVLQIQQDGKTYFLTQYDLKIIRWLQIRIQKYTLHCMDYLKAEFDKAEAEANMQYEEGKMHATPEDEDLQLVDPFGMYTEKEWSKYHLPKGGKVLLDRSGNTEGK